MDKKRIQVYAEPGMKRRIELAAAKYNIPVTEYCLSAIQQQLADDDLLEQAHVDIPVTISTDDDLIADLRELREAILADRGGELLDIDDFIEQMRDERDYEISGLR